MKNGDIYYSTDYRTGNLDTTGTWTLEVVQQDLNAGTDAETPNFVDVPVKTYKPLGSNTSITEGTSSSVDITFYSYYPTNFTNTSTAYDMLFRTGNRGYRDSANYILASSYIGSDAMGIGASWGYFSVNDYSGISGYYDLWYSNYGECSTRVNDVRPVTCLKEDIIPEYVGEITPVYIGNIPGDENIKVYKIGNGSTSSLIQNIQGRYVTSIGDGGD